MVFSVLLAAILDFLRDSWPGLRTWNSSKQKCYFEHESQVCMSAVHPNMMYIVMIIETVSAILAAILFCNFEREELKIELCMGQILNQHIRIVWKQLHDKFY